MTNKLFKNLISTDGIEFQGGHDYVLSSEENEDFYFWYDVDKGFITDFGMDLTSEQAIEIGNRIDTYHKEMNATDDSAEQIKETENFINANFHKLY